MSDQLLKIEDVLIYRHDSDHDIVVPKSMPVFYGEECVGSAILSTKTGSEILASFTLVISAKNKLKALEKIKELYPAVELETILEDNYIETSILEIFLTKYPNTDASIIQLKEYL